MKDAKPFSPHVFVAEPFEGVGGRAPTQSERVQQALAAPTLKASMADRMKPKSQPVRHVPPPASKVAAPTVPALPALLSEPAASDFVPPKDMAEAKRRRDETRTRVMALQVTSGGLSRNSRDRQAIAIRLVKGHAELRNIKQWMHRNRDKTDNGLADTYVVNLMRALVDAMDRAIEEGAVFTNDECDMMDKAASWLSKFEEWEE